MNQKQIYNLSKFCYDMCKLVLGLAVVGNLISDKLSLKALWIGIIIAVGFLFLGYLPDKKEVDNGDGY